MILLRQFSMRRWSGVNPWTMPQKHGLGATDTDRPESRSPTGQRQAAADGRCEDQHRGSHRAGRDINQACRLEGTFVLRSGQTSNEYFDKYLLESQPALLLRVAEAMVPLLPADTQLLGGLELGGIPIATMVSSLTGLPALFVRKQAKTYGTLRLAEGADVTGKTVTLIEDVTTTGGAVRDATIALRTQGARVAVVVCAIDRSETGGGRLAEVDVDTRAVLTKEQLASV